MSSTGFLFQMTAIIVILYFFWFMPAQRQKKKREDMLKAVKRGDEIITVGGIVGEVVHIRETSKDGGTNRLDDRVTIKSGESRLIVERGRIDRVIGSTAVTTASNNPPT